MFALEINAIKYCTHKMKTVIIHDYMIVLAGNISACALPGHGPLGQHGGQAVPASLQDREQRTLREKQRRKGSDE